MGSDGLRVRFAPSPTGYLHVGGARTVLFNWLLARQAGGTFVLRIEDTDRTRHVEDSLPKILDDLRWLGLNWDEGPEVGGDYGPYLQSERLDLYKTRLHQLLETGHAYYALETPQELDAIRREARERKLSYVYRRPDPLPTIEQGLAAEAAGRPVTVRFKMPERDIVVSDVILGEVRLAREELEDFVIRKSDGWPTYHFACVVDDELMRITHVLRGQEHLMNTPKHVAMQDALGFRTPVYAHLPVIFNSDGSKMSKRDKEKAIKKGLEPPAIDVHDFRRDGYLPEALLNFISLLGWSAGDDREQLTLEETVREFSLDRVGASAAKFDRDKLLAFSTDWFARVGPDRLLDALKDFADVRGSALAAGDDAMLARLLDISAGFRTFCDLEKKAAFLFTDDAEIQYDPKSVKKVLEGKEQAGFAMLEGLLPALEGLAEWSESSIERLLTAECEKRGVKLGAVAQPLRVAVTGSTVSPPIYDTLEMLGRDRTVRRIRRTITLKA